MLPLCIVALVVGLASLILSFVLWSQVKQHYAYWDLITDRIIAQTSSVVNNHNNRICELELSLGGVYTPWGYRKAEKA